MASPCDTLDIVPRVSWGARNAKPGLDKAVLPLDMMVYTHTHGPSCSDRHACAAIVREVQAFHMDRKASPFSDIGYSFLIGSDGSIFEGRGWAIRPAYDLRYNGKGFGTAFIGRYASKDNASTPFTHHAAISAHDL
ncbi:peptidoglycan-recognition protein SB2-like [Paramacrobiotus metropolitanus]|uniref:peptidoglycan-recognition protein SB2-like n=1 Tax=Paramacrobiotus metropolitanus TaxID=2943436 RepID=UPI002445BF0F|nr:peptidoglycan-recognition protein SB2-like [Paramacrobiotus metropolitanus]